MKIFTDLPRQNYNKTQLFTSVKIKIIPVKKSQKVSVKIGNAREKILKSAREMQKVTVKKTQKEPKMAFTGTFDFHGKKKHWGGGRIYLLAL